MREICKAHRDWRTEMHIDTKLEIRAAAVRLIPILTKANALAAWLCVAAAFALIVAIVVVAITDDTHINGVTESGEVHLIPLKP